MEPTESTQFTGNRELSHQSGCCDQNFGKPSGSTSNNRGDLTLKRPLFFQIITDDGEAEGEKKLWIPRRFMRNYGLDLSKYVQVTDPSGRKWKLECLKCEADTWLKNGWQDFVDFYSLDYGHLLVFEYGGNSRFSVAIFDEAATEIEYPVKITHDVGDNIDDEKGQDVKMEWEGTDIDEQVTEILDEFLPSNKEKRKWHQYSGDQKAKKLSFSDGECNAEIFIANKCKNRVVVERNEQLKGNEKALDSPYPFFSLIMRPLHLISNSARLYIPFSFAVDYIIEEQCDAILSLDGRRWDVKYFSDISRSVAALGSGWKIFALENDLKAGDVCVFELMNETDVTFRVRVNRVGKNTNPSTSDDEHKQAITEKVVSKKSKKTHLQLKEHGTIESADKFITKNPFFGVVMQPYCLNSLYVNIPVEFVEKHLGQETKNVVLKVENKSWTVKFCAPGRFCGGWDKFVKANSLQEGDICMFELVKKPNLTLEVRIIRGN